MPVKEESDDLHVHIKDEFRTRGFKAGKKYGWRERSAEDSQAMEETEWDEKENKWPHSECIVVDSHY